MLAHPSQLDLPHDPLLLHSAISCFSFIFRSLQSCLPGRMTCILFHKPVDRTFQLLDGILVSVLYRIHDTVLNMILKDDLTCIVDG